MRKIVLCGGDLRQISAANILSRRGYEVFVFKNMPSPYLSEKVKTFKEPDFLYCDTVILPLPCSLDDVYLNCSCDNKPSLRDVFCYISDKHNVYGGKLTPYVKDLATKCGAEIKDLLDDESFSIKNAYLTAEGAVKIALSECKSGLMGMKILITGFGRIGKCLSYLLKNMGAEVFVSARKAEDFAWIENYGYKSLETASVSKRIEEFDVIFNTVPVNILKVNELPDEVLYVELASKPYGIDMEKAFNEHKNVLLAASLPGKEFPIAAGRIIAETVINLEKERGQ